MIRSEYEECVDLTRFKSRVVGGLVLLMPLVVMSAFLFSSGSVSAQGFPKTVWGAVYDEHGDLYVGVKVTVNMWTGGVGGVLHGSYVSLPDPSPDGYYGVIFPDGKWAELDTIQVIVDPPGGGDQAVSTASCDDTGNQQVDVHFETAIPQFGSLIGAFVASCLVGTVAIVTIRKKKSSV
jgi:hypothetical protein